MQHFGDITKLNGAELPVVNIITGGSPCQDLSVAGKRAGLAGERSGLFMEQIRLVKEMRENDRKERRSDAGTDEHIRLRTRYMVWENVPGAFSSNGGEDFRAVLEETAKVADKDAVIPRPPKKWESSGCILGDGWSIAWRTHDAQYWGVPQRRKRICMVADFDGDTAGKILFDVQLRGETEYSEYFQTFAGAGDESKSQIQPVGKSVSGDSEQSESQGKGTSGDIEKCTATSSYTLKIRGGVEVDSQGNKAGKGSLVQTELNATLGVSQDQTLITGCLNSWDVQSKHIQPENGIAEALYSGECRGGGGESYVMQDIDRTIILNDQGGQQMDVSENVTSTLRAQEHGHQPIVFEPGAASRVGGHIYENGISGTVRSNAGDNQQTVAYGFDAYNQSATGEISKPLTSVATDADHTPIVYGISAFDSNAMKSANPHSGIYEAETARTLDLNGGSPACNQGGMAVVQGADVYNGELTGDTAATLTAACGGTNTSGAKVIVGSDETANGFDGFNLNDTGDLAPTLMCQRTDTKNVPSVMIREVFDSSRRHNYKPFGDVCETVQAAYGTGGGNTPIVLERNGQRESHMGDGYKESETMYTLNTIEKHAVAYKKTGHAKSADDGQGWTETNTNDTLNAFDSGEMRTPTVTVSNVASEGFVEVFENHSQDSRYKSLGNTCETVSAKYGTGGNNQPLVVGSITINNDNQMTFADVAACRGAQDGRGGVHSQMMADPEGNFVLENAGYSEKEAYCVGNGQVAQTKISDMVGTLNCMHEQQAVMTFGLDRASFNQGANAKYDFQIDEEKIGTQVAKGPGAVCQSVVRRLTPLECERLQGYPDGWTNIGEWTDSKGKKHKDADSPRYKALGNSIALPFWQWMAERMVKCLRDDGITEPTMASLFDGLGGFPLVYSRCGCKPVWASEIEEFPIAVTKIRFPEE